MEFKKVSIIVPVFNEIQTLEEIILKLENVDLCNLEKEIILIDDFSTDGSRELIEKMQGKYKVFFHEKNEGKGKAVQTGFENAQGEIVIIQDADLEYDPSDYYEIIKLIIDEKADAVYGSRLSGGKPSRSFMFSHLLGNKFLTFVTNFLFNTTLTDMETCYKAFRRDFIKDIKIKSKRFDFEPEITAKILKKHARLYELPISYYGREYKDGKKITWKDGFQALFALIKYRFFD